MWPPNLIAKGRRGAVKKTASQLAKVSLLLIYQITFSHLCVIEKHGIIACGHVHFISVLLKYSTLIKEPISQVSLLLFSTK